MKNTLILITILLSLLVAGTVISTEELHSYNPKKEENFLSICDDGDYASEIHCLTNYARVENRLKPLIPNDILIEVSKNKSEDMCKRGYFSHDFQGRSWEYFIKSSGITYTRAGENLAKGYKTPETATEALLNSPKHYENIMGNYTHMGIYSLDCNGVILTTQTFASL